MKTYFFFSGALVGQSPDVRNPNVRPHHSLSAIENGIHMDADLTVHCYTTPPLTCATGPPVTIIRSTGINCDLVQQHL
jgi:hypothetical protein